MGESGISKNTSSIRSLSLTQNIVNIRVTQWHNMMSKSFLAKTHDDATDKLECYVKHKEFGMLRGA